MRIAAILCLALCVNTGCGGNKPPEGSAPANAASAPLVKVTRPATKPVKWAIEQPATTQALEFAPLVAKLPGYVKAIAPDTAAIKAGAKLPGGQQPVIDIGSIVEANQPLATVHIPELTAEIAEKTALVAKTKAELHQAELELVVSDAQITGAEELVKEAEAGVTRTDADVTRWKAELDQVNAQINSGVADAQTRTVITKNWEAAKAAKAEASAKVATATAAVKERKARRARAQADVEAATARVKVAEAELARVLVMESYTQVKAPFAGVVTARHVHPGHFLQPAGSAHGTVLFTVMRADIIRVFADIPDVNAEKATVGTAVAVRVPALGGREYSTTITRTTGIVDPNTRTLRIEVDIDNKDRALRPGQYATIRINAEANDATVLPSACILGADETHYCYLVEGGKAVKYRVQLGRTETGTAQVLGRRKATATTGVWEQFTPTDAVVEGNLGALADGVDVRTE